jgi:hypothetical protein
MATFCLPGLAASFKKSACYTALPPTRRSIVFFMRADEMRIGDEYGMQRGPSRRCRQVTLLAREAPSGRSHWVLVRMETGVGAGTEKEVPSQSIYHLPGKEPAAQRPNPRLAPKRETEPPPGWLPACGEAVSWARTLGSRFTVKAVDGARGIATIEGVLLGVAEQFDALISELCPFQQSRLVVHDADIEDRLGGRLPEKLGRPGVPLKSKPPRIENVEKDEGVVDRLVFSPDCLNSYRRRFARETSPARAEQRLRAELSGAKKYRRNRQEYLRLRVRGKFEVVLKRRPVQGDLGSSYVQGLNFLGPKKRRQRRLSGRRAA